MKLLFVVVIVAMAAKCCESVPVAEIDDDSVSEEEVGKVHDRIGRCLGQNGNYNYNYDYGTRGGSGLPGSYQRLPNGQIIPIPPNTRNFGLG